MAKVDIAKNPSLLLHFLKDKAVGDIAGSEIEKIELNKKLSYYNYQGLETGLFEYLFFVQDKPQKVCGFFSNKKTLGLKNKKLFLTKLKEYGFQRHNLQIPKILGFYPEINLILREKIEGKTISQMIKEKMPLEEAVKSAADWLVRLHSLKPEEKVFTPMEKMDKKNFKFYLKTIKKHWPAEHKRTKQILKKVREIAKEAPEKTLFHGDFQPQNIVFNETTNTLTAFDFDAAGVGDPLSDAGNFLLQLSYEAHAQIAEDKIVALNQIFLGTYLKKASKTFTNLCQRINIYQAKFAVQKAIYLMSAFLWQGRSPELEATISNLLKKAVASSQENKKIDLSVYPYPYKGK